MERIQDCLATGESFDEGVSVHSVANSLLIFLVGLAEPIIPFKFNAIALKVASEQPDQSYVVCALARFSPY